MSHANGKSQLNAFCIKKARRLFTKDDIVYTTNKFGNQFQATVKLNYYEEPLEFAGDLCSTTKEAEQSAASQALTCAALNDGTFDKPIKAKKTGVAMQTVAPAPAKAGKLMVNPMAVKQQADSSPQQQLSFLVGTQLGRQMTAKDLTYKILQFQGQYQATVTMHCKGGAEFAGELAPNPATASNAAATQALQHLMSEDGNLAATMAAVFGAGSAVAALSQKKKTPDAATSNSKKRKAEGAPREPRAPREDPTPATNSVADGLEMMLKRKPTEIEYFYRTEGTDEDGYTSTLSAPCLPGDLATKQWAGEKQKTKAAAQESAAFEALQVLTEDKEVGKTFSSASNKVMNKMMKGKGGGKGKMAAMAYQSMMMMSMQAAMMQGAWGWGGGGGGGGGSKAGPRKPVAEGKQVTGTVKEWKGQYGWITPSAAIDHAEAKKNEGKIYVAKSDLSGGLTALEAGKTVKFTVYTDGKGLGAEKVEVA